MGLGLVDLSPHWLAFDPQGVGATWTGLAKTAWKGSLFNAAINPEEFAETQLAELKGIVHAEDWTGDRPGLGAGENVFDIATLIAPGLGEAGAAADGAGAAARGAEAEAEAVGAAGRVTGKGAEGLGGITGARGALTDITKASADLPTKLEGVSGNLPEIKPPASGSPVAVPPGKPLESPVESAPRPADGAPPAPQGSTPATTSPGSAGGSPTPSGGPSGGPHGPDSSPTPATSPGGSGGLHDPAPPPAPAAGAPPGGSGLHEPAAEPAPPAAPVAPGGPHDPLSTPSGGPHNPVSTPSGGPREPVSVPAEEPREPVSVPAGGAHEPVAEPEGSPHGLASVSAAGSRLTPMQAAGDGLPSATPQLLEHSPAQVPVSPSGSSGEAAAASAHSPAPHVEAPGGRPAELPSPSGGGAHGPGDGGPPGGHTPGEPSHGAQPHGNGDGGAPKEDRDSHSDHDASGDAQAGDGYVGPYPLPPPELLTPPPDGAFFWSGRTSDGVGIGPSSAGGNGSADLYAVSHGGTTLEGLLERNGISPPKWSFDDPDAEAWWSKVSETYATNSQGEVHAVIGPDLRPGGVWKTVELPRLMDNPRVTKIVIIDPETGAETTVFER